MRQRKTILAAIIALGLGALGSWLGLDLSSLEAALISQEAPSDAQAAEQSSTATSLSNDDADADFDFYLLALSWSPTFCADRGGQNPQQCGAGKRFGFVTHGLWPQFERGYPESCPSSQPREVARVTENAMLDIMPSRGLIRHQWRKHGTCSGLTQQDYFAKVRAATESVSIPRQFSALSSPRRLSAKEVENAFAVSNSQLENNEMAVRCDRGRVKEVRICLTKTLEPRACRQVDARGCQQSNLQLPSPK